MCFQNINLHAVNKYSFNLTSLEILKKKLLPEASTKIVITIFQC